MLPYLSLQCHGYAAGEFPAALSCLASGSLGAVKVLLTHKVPFLSAEKGFKQLYHACDTSGKSVIRVLVEGAK